MRHLWCRPSVLIVEEMEDTRFFNVSTADQLHAAALALLTKRSKDEHAGWYDDAPALWKKKMETAIANADGGWAWQLLLDRHKFEYEEVRLEPFEIVEQM